MINRSFLLLWIAITVSVFGSTFTGLVVQVIAVNDLHASSLEMGALSAVASVVAILLGPVAGLVSDKFRKRSIMISADLFRLLALCIFIILLYNLNVKMHYIIILMAVLRVGDLFFGTAYAAYTPSLVGRDRLIEANSKMASGGSIAAVLGSSAGGLLLTLLGSIVALTLDAISYVVSAAAVLAIAFFDKSAAPDRKSGNIREPFLRSLTEGLRYILRTGELLSLLIRGTILGSLSGAFSSIIFIYYLRVLGLSAFNVGLFTSSMALGLFAGSLIAVRVSKKIGVGPAVAYANVLMALIWGALPFLAPEKIITVPVLTVMYLTHGVCLAVYTINNTSIRQARTADAVLGRAEAAYLTLTLCGTAGGALLMGWLAQYVDTRAALAGLALIAISAAFLGMRAKAVLAIRVLTRMDSPA